MADSENSRTLPSISYRNLSAPAERLLEAMALEQRTAAGRGGNDTLVRWQAWWRANLELSRLGRVQQRLEGELFRTATRLQADIRLLGRTDATFATSPAEVDALLRERFSADARSNALEELAGHRHAWNAADERIGYSRARNAEDVAAEVEQRLAEELCSNPAGSSLAAAAKLHCIINQGEPGPDHDEFPWPQLRSLLADLLMIGAHKPSGSLDH